MQPIAPRALLDSHNRLIDLYAAQAKQAAKVGEIVTDNDQHVSYRLSTANELAERRKTARMYLCFLGFVVAAVTTGVVWIADIARVTSSTAQSIAIWLILFGAVQSWLTWRTLHREQTLSPEGLHLEQIQYDAQVHQTDAETRRLAVDYMGRVELAKVQLQQSQVDAQREANHRLTLETQRQIATQMARHTQPQSTMNRVNTFRAPVAHNAALGPQESPGCNAVQGPMWYVQDDDTDVSSTVFEQAEQQVEQAPPIEPIVDPVREAMLRFTMDVMLAYKNDDQGCKVFEYINPDGQIVNTVVPWSKRGGLSVGQRRQAQEILRQITPPLYEQRNNAWYVNLRCYRRVGDAVDAIGQAVTPREGWE